MTNCFFPILLSAAALLLPLRADDRPVLTVPVRIHLVHSATMPALHTTLVEADVRRVFEKVNRIWAPAGIRLEVESIGETIALEPPESAALAGEQARVQAAIPRERRSALALNVCYVKAVRPNGYYDGELIVVKDTARLREVEGGLDEPLPRVTAHEIGHALGLPHRQDTFNLMASGTTGYALNAAEIETARATAEKNFPTAAERGE